MEQEQLLSKRTTEYRKVRFASKSTDYFFIFVIVALLASLAVWGGTFVYKKTLNGQIDGLLTQIKDIETDLSEEFGDDNLTTLSDKIAAAKELLAGHAIVSKVFTLLQDNTLPKVAYGSFSFQGEGKVVTMAASAANYQVLADQIGIFEGLDQVERVEFGGLTLVSGNVVSFTLMLTMNDSFLRLSTQTE